MLFPESWYPTFLKFYKWRWQHEIFRGAFGGRVLWSEAWSEGYWESEEREQDAFNAQSTVMVLPGWKTFCLKAITGEGKKTNKNSHWSQQRQNKQGHVDKQMATHHKPNKLLFFVDFYYYLQSVFSFPPSLPFFCFFFFLHSNILHQKSRNILSLI